MFLTSSLVVPTLLFPQPHFGVAEISATKKCVICFKSRSETNSSELVCGSVTSSYTYFYAWQSSPKLRTLRTHKPHRTPNTNSPLSLSLALCVSNKGSSLKKSKQGNFPMKKKVNKQLVPQTNVNSIIQLCVGGTMDSPQWSNCKRS